MLVDVVTYSGERDMLLARLDTLQPDVCVVVESNATFTGTAKRFTFQQAPVDGVTFVPHLSPGHANAWENEFAQRDAGMNAVRELDVPGHAIVGFFDVDEIPDPVLLREKRELSAWRMAKHSMSVYWYQQDELTGVSGAWSAWQGERVSVTRRHRGLLPKIEGGWHLSNFLAEPELLAKWLGFSHTELRRPNMAQWIAHCLDKGLAIENGQALKQLDNPVLPEPFFDGPDFWYRVRHVA